LPPAVVATAKADLPIATLLPPVVKASKDALPTPTLSSPVVIAVPAFVPNNALPFASVPLKLSPAPVPATVLFCPSLVTPVSTCAQVRPPVLPDCADKK